MNENCIAKLLPELELKDSFSITYWKEKKFDSSSVCRTRYHRIFLLSAGSGSLQIDDATYAVGGNVLFLLAQGQLYSFSSQASLTGYELCFGDCFWEKAPASASNCKAVLFSKVSDNQRLPVRSADKRELTPLFQALYQEFLKEEYVNKPDALAAYLKIIMIKIANLSARSVQRYNSPEYQLYNQFVELLGKQYQVTHHVADFARQVGVSARKLNEVCKRYGGRGAKDMINDQLIAEAKRSLQFSTRPIKDIAFQLRFANPYQFSHFFKKYTSVSPQHYRSQFVKIGM